MTFPASNLSASLAPQIANISQFDMVLSAVKEVFLSPSRKLVCSSFKKGSERDGGLKRLQR